MTVYRNLRPGRISIVITLIFGLCIFCGIQLIKIKALEEHVHTVNNSDEESVSNTASKYKDYSLFQSNEPIDFPVETNRIPRIPRIIHQICDSEFVLELFSDPMQSFVEKNPSWEYRFWTYKSGRNFLESHYPYVLEIYDSFGENSVRKSDLLRFAVMHEFGGVYADLDVKNLRPLDRATIKYACIVPTEPFEHSAIGYRIDTILSTAVLLCRPKHPFFKQLLLNMQIADPEGDPVLTTGPWYITQMYMAHNGIDLDDFRKTKTDNSSNSPYFYKGTRPEDDDDAVYIPNSQYFMDNVDVMFIDEGELKVCIRPQEDKRRQDLINRACNEFESRKLLRKNRTYTFTHHYWFHMWLLSQNEIDGHEKVHVKSVIPNCILHDNATSLY